MANMHEFVASGNLSAIDEAVASDPQTVNQPNESGLPPLYTAALYGNESATDLLLNHGADIDIFACAYLGRPADAESLLSGNPDLVRLTTADGMTPLHFAARAGHCNVAEILTRFGADVNARNHDGVTVLMEACHGGPWKPLMDEELAQLLLDNGAEVDLFDAAAMGRTDLIDALIDQDGETINDLNAEEETALSIAARNNHLAAVKRLVERGADVNRADAVGIAALHRTSQQCSDELIQYLIDSGSNAHLCCHVACGDEAGTHQSLANNPNAAGELFYEFIAIEYAIHSWQLGTLRILLQPGAELTEEHQQHILRISDGDEQLLNELIATRPH